MNPSRNDPCYCGSGKKYKKCCLHTNEVVDFQKAAEKKALKKIFEEMDRFLDSQGWEDELGTAEKIFSCELEDQPADEDNRELLHQELDQDTFLNWFFLDYFIDDDSRPIDRFLTKLQDDFGPKELQIAKLLQSSYVSLYEVFELIPHRGFAIRDIFSGREFFLNSKIDTNSITQGLLLTARLITVEDRSYPIDMGFSFLPSEVPMIQELARRTQDEVSEKQGNKISREKFLKIMGAIFFNLYYLEHTKILQAEEDCQEQADLLPYAEFQTLNFDAARESLRSMPEISFTRESLMLVEAEWIDKREGEEESVSGYITLIPAKMVFECQTSELLKRGKKLLADRLKNNILHQTDHLEHPGEFEEEMQEAEEYFRHWLDEQQPVLNGHTPREAAEIPDLKERLVWVFKEIEYLEKLNRKQNGYDIDRLKRELNLL